MKGKKTQKPLPGASSGSKPIPTPSSDSALGARLNKLENWLSKNTLYVAIILFIAALAPRVSYFQEMKDAPVKVFVNWDQGDLEFFNSWAKVIASGNWLSDTILHPYHSWHDDFAIVTGKQIGRAHV